MTTIGIQRHVKATTDQLLRLKGSSLSQSTHILATNVPRSAIPADIRRVCVKHKIDNVSDIAMDYYRFSPTGRAWLTIHSPDHMHYTLKAMNGAVISGKLLEVAVANDPKIASSRTRGVKGRLEAVERGLITGNGPDGKTTSQGKAVVIYGLPGKITSEAVQGYLKDFRLAATEGGQKEVVKLPFPHKRLVMKSRFYVRLASVSEAHRLVRELHMTFFEPNIYDNKYSLRAHVVY